MQSRMQQQTTSPPQTSGPSTKPKPSGAPTFSNSPNWSNWSCLTFLQNEPSAPENDLGPGEQLLNGTSLSQRPMRAGKNWQPELKQQRRREIRPSRPTTCSTSGQRHFNSPSSWPRHPS